ncbi:Purple acid phosphatase 15 [Hibiscus syriacus]|uniref:acid phosphatase n=1 Tax=Hibiscus syriacus TaxID=106335 RepID=A0A6A2YF91_HIBSY|nr:Purple acid phosphatase 15 [Hibiscus syriacus]
MSASESATAIQGTKSKDGEIFTNREHMGFSNVSDFPPSDAAILSPDNLKGKPLVLKYVKFQNVRSLTIFIEDNQSGSEITKVQKIALYGSTSYPKRIAVVGDLGLTYNTTDTISHLKRNKPDSVLLVGNVTYADLYLTNGTGSDCYDAHFHRLQYMRPISLVGITGGAKQYKWLERDLANVDRSVTPWLVATWHPPWYNSYKAHYKEAECTRVEMEELLYSYSVDIVLNGHVHAYERSNRVYNHTLDPCGPVHITVGDGGNREKMAVEHADEAAAGNFCWDRQPDFSAFRKSSFGHGILEHDKSCSSISWEWDDESQAFKMKSKEEASYDKRTTVLSEEVPKVVENVTFENGGSNSAGKTCCWQFGSEKVIGGGGGVDIKRKGLEEKTMSRLNCAKTATRTYCCLPS